MDTGNFAKINQFLMKSLTAPCLAHPQKGMVTLPEAMYDFTFNYSENGRTEYYNYGAMREVFINAGEYAAEMRQDDNNAWNAIIPIKVRKANAVSGCGVGGCNETTMIGGSLGDEVFMKVNTKEFKAYGKFCLNDFKYVTPKNTTNLSEIRSPKDITRELLSAIQREVDYSRAMMFYNDGSGIVAEISEVITSQSKFRSSHKRKVQWLRNGVAYAVFRPLSSESKCLAPMAHKYKFLGFAEVKGNPDMADNTFLVQSGTTLVATNGASQSLPSGLTVGDVLVPLQNNGATDETNSMWTATSSADGDGYKTYASCAVEGIYSLLNYVGQSTYRCIDIEQFPDFKFRYDDCCDATNGDVQCKPFDPLMIWNEIQITQQRTGGRFGNTLLMMTERTYEAMRQATLDDVRFSRVYNNGERVNIGANAWKITYDDLTFVVDNNLRERSMIITTREVFKRVTPVYGDGFYRKSGALAFVPTASYNSQQNTLTPNFVKFDSAGNAVVEAMAKWEYEYVNMVPASTAYLNSICTDFVGCAVACRDICA